MTNHRDLYLYHRLPRPFRQPEMTTRSLEVLRAIAAHWKVHCQWPTFQDLMAVLGITSKSTCWGHLDRLRRLGLLIHTQIGSPRSTQISDKGWSILSSDNGTTCCPCCGRPCQ